MYASRFLKSRLPISCALRKISAELTATPRKDTRAVSFIMAMNSFPVGGMMTLIAWGRTIRRIRCR